tara:strand:+ start:18535 stop:20199 length:1665 start_codon:yes stop_codon:yes gene_type:complete
MTVFDMSLITDLQSDPTIGAGNFFHKLLERGVDTDRKTIHLDGSIELPSGEHVDQLSLSDIAQLSEFLAIIYRELGVAAKDPVALYFDNTIHYFVHFIAITRLGALPVFVNGNMASEVSAEFIRRTGAVLVLTTNSRLQQLQEALDSIPAVIDVFTVEQVCKFGAPLRRETSAIPKYRHDAKDPVLLAHTSGTTGIPKAVQFNHEGFYFGVKQQLHKQVGSRILTVLPHSHASDLSILMSSLLRGCEVLVLQDQAPDPVLDAIANFKPDLIAAFPKSYVDLCRYELDQYDLSSISYWLSTGDANHEPHIRKLIKHGSHKKNGEQHKGSIFIDNLGSSEFGFAMFRNIHKPGSKNYGRNIGRPFGWVDACVLGDGGDSLPPYQVGKLGVKSSSVTTGYWNNSLLTEKNRLAGYWLTGDLAFKDSEGAFFHVDRVTDQIMTSEGILYSCQAEELILCSFQEIFDCSIVGVDTNNCISSALITVEPVTDEIDQVKLLENINQLLRELGLPAIEKIVLQSAEMHLGPTGKKLKRVLRGELSGMTAAVVKKRNAAAVPS